MDSRLALPQNTVLDNSYRIERVIGSGGFGITYDAEDIKLRTKVALKEYYPADFGDHDATMSVRPKSKLHRKTFIERTSIARAALQGESWAYASRSPALARPSKRCPGM